MKRGATTLPGSRIYAVLLAFAALLLAMAFSVAPAFAEEPDGTTAPTVQGSEGQAQRYVAVLYDDGELVIKKADSADPTAQNGTESSGVSAGEDSTGSASNSVEGQDEGSDNGTKTDGPDGTEQSGPGASASGTALRGPLGSVSSGPDAVQSGTVDAASTVPTGLTQHGCKPPLGPAGWPEFPCPTTRQVVATYDDVQEGADRADHVKWYGSRDKIKRVTFGEGVTPENMAYWFAGLGNLSDISFVGLDTSQATSMESLFDGCGSLKKLDAKALDTSHVTCMSRLFAGCASLTEIDLSNFDTSNVTDMSGMFEGCSSVRSLDLSSFDTSKVKSTKGMLEGCSSLSALDASSFSASQLSAMSVPTDNKGGFWRFNVPADFETNVVLRAPTQEEKAAAGLLLSDPEENGKPASDLGGGLVPRPSGENGETSPAANTDKQKADSTSAEHDASAQAKAGASADARALTDVEADNGIEAGMAAPTGIFDPAPVAASKEEEPNQDQLAQVVNAVSEIAQGAGYGAFIAESVTDGLLGGALRLTKELAGALALSPPGVTAVMESLAEPWPAAPMAPFGIPLNALATVLLLLIAVPVTVLILRDQRP